MAGSCMWCVDGIKTALCKDPDGEIHDQSKFEVQRCRTAGKTCEHPGHKIIFPVLSFSVEDVGVCTLTSKQPH
jgi:hypothetical protein